jgi:TnpA family transposase
MDYPHINTHISDEELFEHFTLSQDERFLLPQWRKEKNLLGFAVLLKSFVFLGFPPRMKEDIPASVILCLSRQLNIEPEEYAKYDWKSSLWNIHLASIREFTGFRPFTGDDFNVLIQWVIDEAKSHPSRLKMYSAAIRRCRSIRLELPVEKEFQRLVNSAWQQYLNIVCQKISERLIPEVQDKMDKCINADLNDKNYYEWMRKNTGKLGMKTLLEEIKLLKFVKDFGINADTHLKDIPDDVLKLLHERVAPEGVYSMRRHQAFVRYALIAVLLNFRRMELTDNIIEIFIQLIHRIRKKADKKMERNLIRNIQAVYKKRELLYTIAKASTCNPQDTIENVLFPAVGKEILYQIIEEYEGREIRYKNTQAVETKKRYIMSYRKMMKPVMDNLVFRTCNPVCQPVIEGVTLVRKYLDTKNLHYPETEKMPEGLLSGIWKEMATEKYKNDTRIVKHYFELCLLHKLEKALKNKEVWVEGSDGYRNPDQDMPHDWAGMRVNYCRKHLIPERSEDFVDPIREELVLSLGKAHTFFNDKQDVYIYYPGKGDKGLFRIPKIVRGQEHPILQEIKQKTLSRWGILDLADILLEADRQVEFSRFFYSTAQRQVLNYYEIRERLLLSLLGRGTGIGLKRIHAAARPSFSYEDLIYFNRRFVHTDSVREATAALLNRILEVRTPEIWGSTTSCTSDGKYLGAWGQNLAAQWNPHYHECGIMSYFLVDKHSAGIHSQVRRGTEVAAMISSLILHDTRMMVETNCIDSHGQSELGFAFCRFLSVELCPWLKRMKYERLYLPDISMKESFPALAGVVARAIRWDTIHEHYDDMIRHVVAARERTAPVDSLLRRFNRNNPANQTYKGFLEAGKALKTIHNCRFLTDQSYRQKIHTERNVAESWNSAVDFICYGGKAEIQTNDPATQELTVLCLHLLQNSLVLVNTMMLERILYDDGYIHKMNTYDINAMTPLFTSNVNPYGDIHLDMHKPSFLGVH